MICKSCGLFHTVHLFHQLQAVPIEWSVADMRESLLLVYDFIISYSI